MCQNDSTTNKHAVLESEEGGDASRGGRPGRGGRRRGWVTGGRRRTVRPEEKGGGARRWPDPIGGVGTRGRADPVGDGHSGETGAGAAHGGTVGRMRPEAREGGRGRRAAP